MPDYSGHMTHDEYIVEIRRKLLQLAHAILSGEVGLVEGCMHLWPILRDLDLTDEFLILVGVASEGDRFVFGEDKTQLSDDELSHMDLLLSDFESANRQLAEDACKMLIDRFETLWTVPTVAVDLSEKI